MVAAAHIGRSDTGTILQPAQSAVPQRAQCAGYTVGNEKFKNSFTSMITSLQKKINDIETFFAKNFGK
jgi:hypothetical protein